MVHMEEVEALQGEGAQGSSRSVSIWHIWNRFGIYIILIGFAVVLSLLTDRFLTTQNLLNVARQIAVLTLISLGILITVIPGNVDLTVGSFLGLAGALFAGWTIRFGLIPGLLMGFGVALVAGWVNGFLTTRGKGLSVIVTLAMLTIFQGITLLYTNGRPIIGFPESIRVLGRGYLGPIPVPVLIALFISAAVHVVLRYTTFGRELYAIGGNEEAARLSGIRVKHRMITTFMISAMLSATAGLLMIARVSSAQPNAGIGDEFTAVGAVLIGGASLNGGLGSVVGTLAGVVILGMISNGLNLLQVNPFYQYVVKGLIILFAILMDQLGRK
jgi:ribose transport system permease protein